MVSRKTLRRVSLAFLVCGGFFAVISPSSAVERVYGVIQDLDKEKRTFRIVEDGKRLRVFYPEKPLVILEMKGSMEDVKPGYWMVAYGEWKDEDRTRLSVKAVTRLNQRQRSRLTKRDALGLTIRDEDGFALRVDGKTVRLEFGPKTGVNLRGSGSEEDLEEGLTGSALGKLKGDELRARRLFIRKSFDPDSVEPAQQPPDPGAARTFRTK